jgi:hypothetical protein
MEEKIRTALAITMQIFITLLAISIISFATNIVLHIK